MNFCINIQQTIFNPLHILFVLPFGLSYTYIKIKHIEQSYINIIYEQFY